MADCCLVTIYRDTGLKGRGSFAMEMHEVIGVFFCPAYKLCHSETKVSPKELNMWNCSLSNVVVPRNAVFNPKFIPFNPLLGHHLIGWNPINACVSRAYSFRREVPLRKISWLKSSIRGAQGPLPKVIVTVKDMGLSSVAGVVPAFLDCASDSPQAV